LSLRETTRLILKLVEEHSGYPVQIIDDPSLNTLASIRLARRGGVPAHILAYRPAGNQAPDYLIAFQCGFALRLFAVPPELRLETGMNQAGLRRVREALEQTLRQNRHSMAVNELEEAATQMYGGLMTHLRSVPVGLRIGRWLRESFPDLRALQRNAVDQELKQNLEAARSARGGLLPEVVVKPTLAINAAFAQFWAREYGDPDLGAGYTSGPNARDGERAAFEHQAGVSCCTTALAERHSRYRRGAPGNCMSRANWPMPNRRRPGS
jgi:hypothetical protein